MIAAAEFRKARAVRDLTTAEVNGAKVSRREDQEEDGALENVCNLDISDH